ELGDAGQEGEDYEQAVHPASYLLHACGELCSVAAWREETDRIGAPSSPGQPEQPIQVDHAEDPCEHDEPQVCLADTREGGARGTGRQAAGQRAESDGVGGDQQWTQREGPQDEQTTSHDARYEDLVGPRHRRAPRDDFPQSLASGALVRGEDMVLPGHVFPLRAAWLTKVKGAVQS